MTARLDAANFEVETALSADREKYTIVTEAKREMRQRRAEFSAVIHRPASRGDIFPRHAV